MARQLAKPPSTITPGKSLSSVPASVGNAVGPFYSDARELRHAYEGAEQTNDFFDPGAKIAQIRARAAVLRSQVVPGGGTRAAGLDLDDLIGGGGGRIIETERRNCGDRLEVHNYGHFLRSLGGNACDGSGAGRKSSH
jgi:hypothetical protein